MAQTKTKSFSFDDESLSLTDAGVALLLAQVKQLAENTGDKETEKMRKDGWILETHALKTTTDNSETEFHRGADHKINFAEAELKLTFIRDAAAAGKSRPSLKDVDEKARQQKPDRSGSGAESATDAKAEFDIDGQQILAEQDQGNRFAKDGIADLTHADQDKLNNWQMDYLEQDISQLQPMEIPGAMALIAQLDPGNAAFRQLGAQMLGQMAADAALPPTVQKLSAMGAQVLSSPDYMAVAQQVMQQQAAPEVRHVAAAPQTAPVPAAHLQPENASADVNAQLMTRFTDNEMLAAPQEAAVTPELSLSTVDAENGLMMDAGLPAPSMPGIPVAQQPNLQPGWTASKTPALSNPFSLNMPKAPMPTASFFAAIAGVPVGGGDTGGSGNSSGALN